MGWGSMDLLDRVLLMDKIQIYSNGIIHCSVCAPKDMDRAIMTTYTNFKNPTGGSPWVISDEKFRTGEDNPCQCNDDGGRLHYLMVC